jgi:hypothetical protein
MYAREKRLIEEAIDKLRLDLSGLVVLTEAASGNYVHTPLICAAAGARDVIALTGDSKYASTDEVRAQTQSAARDMGLAGRVRIVTELPDDLWAAGDIVTNLGFLRPFDSHIVEKLKPTAALPIMFETWEHRHSDVDLEACWRRGICVLGTNEEHGAVKILDYLGALVAKKMFELGIEVIGSRVVVIGTGKFFFKVCETLAGMKAQVLRWLADFEEGEVSASEDRLAALAGADAIVVADEPNSTRCAVGSDGFITAADIVEHCKDAVVIQLGGSVSRPELAAAGVACIPDAAPAPGHMGWSLSELGPKPVIDLHAAGLKVGELLARGRLAGQSAAQATRAALENPICQDFSVEQKRLYDCPF